MAANGYQMHILIGNLGADPKVNLTKSGQKVCNFDIAVNERNLDGSEVVTWYGIAAWNGLGEVCAQYLKKGRSVMVEGTRMKADAWFGQGGNLYTKMELTANEVKFLGNGNGAYINGNGGHYNGNGHHNGNRNSASIKKRPTNQPKRQIPHQSQAPHQPQAPRQSQAPRQPQAPHQPPAQHAPHQRKQPPTSRHEQEYFVPHNPDEIPF